MTVSLLKGMRVQLKVKEGEGPWFDVPAITGPLPQEAHPPIISDRYTGGHFLIFDPNKQPNRLYWVTPGQIEDVEYDLAAKLPPRRAPGDPPRPIPYKLT